MERPNGECAAKASDSSSIDGSSIDEATARGACLRRFCILVQNCIAWLAAFQCVACLLSILVF